MWTVCGGLLGAVKNQLREEPMWTVACQAKGGAAQTLVALTRQGDAGLNVFLAGSEGFFLLLLLFVCDGSGPSLPCLHSYIIGMLMLGYFIWKYITCAWFYLCQLTDGSLS